MCGITGFSPALPWGDDAGPLIRRMAGALAHRGPDDERIHVTPDVALGFRRLSIIDLETGGQPMSTPDGRFTLVMNGEIYNYRGIRDDLTARGVTFRTRSDSESLLALYAREGPGCVEKLDGMFAFAVWDATERSLCLARDRVGKKPLLYALLPGGGIAFASELKSLLEHPGLAREIDPEAVNLYLAYQVIPGPRSIYRGVRKLPPAHTLLWRPGREPELRRYWSLDFTLRRPAGSPESRVEECRDQLRAAVRRRLVADVPLGAFLSGGVDSSAVVAFMSEAGERVTTFSIGFEDERYSELPAARAVARHFGTDHHELIVRPDAAELLPRLAAAWDEPYADCSALPTYCLSEFTRRHVTVALSGDGGDEAFAGYSRYRWIAPALRQGSLIGVIPAPLRRAAAALLPGRPRAFRGLARLLRDGARPFALWNEVWYCLFGQEERRALYDPAFLERLPQLDVTAGQEQAFAGASAGNPIDRALWMDLTRNLPDDLLVKVDIASMAHGLEVRSPFLDHHLLEWAATLPVAEKRRGADGKRILKAALRPLLPPGILDRPKQGFSLPVDDWFRGPLRPLLTETLLGARARARGYFRPAAVEQLIREHAAGRRAHGQRLWCLLMFELWHQVVHERGPDPSRR